MMACATASFGFKSMQHWLTNRMTLTEKKCVSCFYFLERCSWISLTTYRMLARFNAVRLFIFDDSSLIFEHYHRRSQGEAKGAMAPPIFGKYGDFVVWEAFFQTNYLPNIKHFAPPPLNFWAGYATEHCKCNRILLTEYLDVTVFVWRYVAVQWVCTWQHITTHSYFTCWP